MSLYLPLGRGSQQCPKPLTPVLPYSHKGALPLADVRDIEYLQSPFYPFSFMTRTSGKTCADSLFTAGQGSEDGQSLEHIDSAAGTPHHPQFGI